MSKRKLNYEDAIEIWIRRWLGEEKLAIILEFEQNPYRVYEIWEEETFVGSREDAEITFRTRYPALANSVDFSPHTKTRRLISRRLCNGDDDRQGDLF